MMTARQIEIDALCHQHGVSGAVRERIVRLNPDTPEGARLRGYHPNSTSVFRAELDLVGKGEFIRSYGSAAWNSLPNGLIYRNGRRCYVARTTIEDRTWRVWSGEIPPHSMMAWFPTKKYANDPSLVIEWITGTEFCRRRSQA